MLETIKVHVAKYPDRDNLMMRYKCPLTGKQVARTTGTTNAKEAAKVAAKWESELQEGRYNKTSRMTWEEFRDNHEQIFQAGIAAETAKKYQTTFNFIESHMRPKLLRSVTTEAIAKWAVSLMGKGRNVTTVGVYCRHLRASLNWARDMGYIAEAPKVKVPKPPSDARTMKGRPIVTEEHERILLAAAKVVPSHQLESWQRFLNGLWWGGLRLNEALRLSWCESADVAVANAEGILAIRFMPQGHKARRAEIIPCAPEFAELLQATPKRERRGKVFRLSHFRRHGDLAADTVGGLIADIAKLAGVMVTDKKPATAHDYRRAFGTRWSRRVKPATLQRLMRHRDIQTTMKYYVEQDLADMMADMMASMGNKAGNTPAKQARILAS